MAAQPEAPERETTASPLDRHAAPVSDRPAGAGKTRHGRATAALIVSILGILLIIIPIVGLILGIVGTVLAATARSDINRRGMVGGGKAKAALICGIIAIVGSLAWWIAQVAIITSNTVRVTTRRPGGRRRPPAPGTARRSERRRRRTRSRR